ncbi:SGNH/GDSL hydrolase family protein [Planctomycetes bacterium Pan216]|uniref:SGNH/GDSL hydrolase family protein n=1 Tax=Kolteria novifilia TaxID=2527975 RepID=UPI0011A51BA5
MVLLAVAMVGSLLIAEAIAQCWTTSARPIGSVVGEPYPASASDDLPFTLPTDWEFLHERVAMRTLYRTNNAGFRDDRPLAIPKPDNQRRILVLGDSFVLGWGVAQGETFVRVAEASLNDVAPTRLLNGGYRAGYTLDHYLLFLRREADRLSVDEVVVAIYTGNDLEDMRENRWMGMDEDGLPTRIETRRPYVDFTGRFIDSRHNDVSLPLGLERLALPRLVTRALWRTPRDWPKLSEEKAAERLRRVIREIDDFCRARACPLGWILIDSQEPTERSTRSRTVCREALRDPNALWLETESLFERSGLRADEFFIPGDGHFTPAAHRLVGEELAKLLSSPASR